MKMGPDEVPPVVFAVAKGSKVMLANRALVVIEEVEPAYLVRAVVGAITGADAAIVGHHVEPFLVMRGRIDGADILAWSGFTMLAEHGLDDDLGVVYPRLELLLAIPFECIEKLAVRLGAMGCGERMAGVIAVDAQPMHLAPAADLILADDEIGRASCRERV